MKISKKSWHYRLLKVYGWWVPANLCPYFWKVMFALTLIPFFASGAAVVAVILTAPIWRFFIDAHEVLPFVGAAVDIGILSVVLAELGFDRREKKRLERRLRMQNEPPPEPKERKPSLFREWLRAQHDKICPVLDFESN